MNSQTKIYAPVQAVHVSGDDVAKHEAWLKERGLDGECKGRDNKQSGKHGWLRLPQEEGNKQYLICIHCLEGSHE